MTKFLEKLEQEKETISTRLLAYHKEYSDMIDYTSNEKLPNNILEKMKTIDNNCYTLMHQKRNVEEAIFTYHQEYNKMIEHLNIMLERHTPPFNNKIVCRTVGLVEKDANEWIEKAFLFELVSPHPRKKDCFVVHKKSRLVSL